MDRLQQLTKVAIFGCRDGRYLYEQIKQSHDAGYEVKYFADNDVGFIGREICDILIVAAVELIDKYESGEIEAVIITVRKGYSRYCIVEQLRQYGIENIILMRPSPLTYSLPIVFDRKDSLYQRQWILLKEVTKPIIYHLEAHAADGCNLNCRGCLHFSNLYNRNEFPDLNKLLEDIEAVSRHCEIFQFRVLGGEPLLNPELPNFLSELRKLLPHTDIAVISNGILIPHIEEFLLDVMRENGIGFNLTLYPPTLRIKDRIYKTLEQAGVSYGSHETETNEFQKFICLDKKKASSKAYQSCVSRGILTLRDGRLYKCPIETYIERYYVKYEMKQRAAAKGIDIHDESIDWRETVSTLTANKGEFCRHCSEYPVSYAWKNSTPEKSDWLVEETDA